MQSSTLYSQLEKTLSEELFALLREKTGDGVGITRLAYSDKENLAFDMVEACAREHGLETERDAGGNLVVTLQGADASLPFVGCGSHLDSVPQGGNFDGAAGVVAGLAALARLKKEDFTPRRSLKLYAIRGEESARFGKAYMGSLALLGKLGTAELAAKDANGVSMADAMRETGVAVDRIANGEALLDPQRMAAWLELHIEQGPVLVAEKLPMGVVTGIRGNYRHRGVECVGEPGHSGAVPGWLRHDALIASADLVMRLDAHWQQWLAQGKDIVVTFGIFGTDPQEHAITRIPGNVRFSFDVRSQDKSVLDAFHALFEQECKSVEEKRGVSFAIDRRIESGPAVMDAALVARLKKSAETLGLVGHEIPSGAGHDAAVFAEAGIPSAMIFVRNEHGSHNPKEAMTLEDFLAGVAVMRETLKELGND